MNITEERLREILEELFRLQHDFNIKTNGGNYLSGVANNGKKISWLRCINLEVAEAIESTPYKHWKDGELDIDNVEMEVTDILHFLISKTIEIVYKHTTLSNSEGANIEDILHTLNSNGFIYERLLSSLNGESLTEKQLETRFEELIPNTLEDFNLKASLVGISGLVTNQELTEMWSKFFTIIYVLDGFRGFDIKELRKLYILKNALNKVRQMNGYKEGTYIKMWGDKEDNYVAREIMGEKTFDLESCITILNSYYQDIKDGIGIINDEEPKIMTMYELLNDSGYELDKLTTMNKILIPLSADKGEFDLHKTQDYTHIEKYLKLEKDINAYGLTNDVTIKQLGIVKNYFMVEGGRTDDTYKLLPGNFYIYAKRRK
jgi:dimeric dUTPase (all-alpha-NTP-PPase superfamily)